MMRGDKQLLELFERLAPEQQDRLIAFAEFLADEPASAPDGALAPLVIPRPEEESVTMAIRRLVRSYPMLDRRRLMVEASRFMAQHALEGRDAAEVIDELEIVFSRHFEQYRAEIRRQKTEGQGC